MENNNNSINTELYNFINMYNLIINHCANRKRTYNVDLFYINNSFNFRITDKESNKILHNDSIECTEEEAEIVSNLLSQEFVLNHKVKYSIYKNYHVTDRTLINADNANNYSFGPKEILYNGVPVKIHVLENSIFTLSVYLMNGINEKTDYVHYLALEKAYNLQKK